MMILCSETVNKQMHILFSRFDPYVKETQTKNAKFYTQSNSLQGMQVFCFKEKTRIFNKFLKTAYVHFSRFISIFLERCFWCIIMFIELKISHWRATRLGLLFFSFPVCYSI